jgi:photosystem II stability/assembly factor-like uncharacterized protein
MTDSFDITKMSNSRVFLIEGRARADHVPSYKSCLRMTAVTQGFGDIERIECPDPHRYGQFIEVGQIRGATERATTSLEGRYPLNAVSDLLRLARKGCSIDVQVHFGSCTDPSAFNKFEKDLVFEGAYLTTYNTEDLGALASGDNAVVNETGDLSAISVYELIPITYARRADSVITNEILDVVICDSVSCGECDVESDGCQAIFAISTAAGGSPGTPPDVIYSKDKGATWFAHDVESLSTGQAPNAIECLGDYIIVVSNAAGNLNYALKSEFDETSDPEWTGITTGFVAGGAPRNAWSTGAYAFIVGDNGYVYGTSDPTVGVTVLDAGSATVDRLLGVHGLSDTFAVAVGNNGTVIFTTDGTNWTPATAKPVGVGINLLTVWVKSETEWWVGTSNGRAYYTTDGGQIWHEQTFTGSGSGTVESIVFSTKSEAWLAHTTTTPHGRILRSFDGGQSWVVTPESSSASMPLNDSINALAVCEMDPNFIVGVGLADDAADGFIIIGS